MAAAAAGAGGEIHSGPPPGEAGAAAGEARGAAAAGEAAGGVAAPAAAAAQQPQPGVAAPADQDLAGALRQALSMQVDTLKLLHNEQKGNAAVTSSLLTQVKGLGKGTGGKGTLQTHAISGRRDCVSAELTD